MATIWDTPFELPKAGLRGQSFGRRAVAYVLDNVIYLGSLFLVVAFFAIASSLVLTIAYPNHTPVPQSNAADQYIEIWSVVLFFIYTILFEWLFGATPGKLLLGMRVVTAVGQPCGLLAAAVRAALRLIDGLFFAIPAYASMSSSDLRQRLGDKAARTVVVRSSDPAIVRRRSGWLFLVAATIYLLVITGFALYYLLVGLRLETFQPAV